MPTPLEYVGPEGLALRTIAATYDADNDVWVWPDDPDYMLPATELPDHMYVTARSRLTVGPPLHSMLLTFAFFDEDEVEVPGGTANLNFYFVESWHKLGLTETDPPHRGVVRESDAGSATADLSKVIVIVYVEGVPNILRVSTITPPNATARTLRVVARECRN